VQVCVGDVFITKRREFINELRDTRVLSAAFVVPFFLALWMTAANGSTFLRANEAGGFFDFGQCRLYVLKQETFDSTVVTACETIMSDGSS
jgi:hypothetical protein